MPAEPGKYDPKKMEEFNDLFPRLKDFWPFQAIMLKESHRGAVLVSCGFLEQQLADILLSFFRDDVVSKRLVEGAGSAPLGTFSARINACFALGLITTDEHHDIEVLRRIRNDFAHHTETTFDTQSVKDRCNNLRMKSHDYIDQQGREVKVAPFPQFQSAAVSIIMKLTNRAHYVSETRRTETDWPY